MPELPEAETIARGLREVVTGRVVENVEVLHDDVLRVPREAFRAAVRGRTIEGVGRRAKKVLLWLSGDSVLVVHLGMTGRLLPLLNGGPAPPFAPTHPALLFRLSGGGTLVYDDVRRFGLVEVLSTGTWKERSLALGPEPLGRPFTSARLGRDLAGSRTPIRSWLLDQRRVAGVGNIYACEALWRARVHPVRPAGRLTPPEVRHLHRALRSVLNAAIGASGTTLRDYRTADGRAGSYAYALAAYGREGSPCPRCRTPIERIVFAQRSAFLCPRCQPECP